MAVSKWKLSVMIFLQDHILVQRLPFSVTKARLVSSEWDFPGLGNQELICSWFIRGQAEQWSLQWHFTNEALDFIPSLFSLCHMDYFQVRPNDYLLKPRMLCNKHAGQCTNLLLSVNPVGGWRGAEIWQKPPSSVTITRASSWMERREGGGEKKAAALLMCSLLLIFPPWWQSIWP